MRMPILAACSLSLVSLATVYAEAQTAPPAPTFYPPPGSYHSRLQVSLFDAAGSTGPYGPIEVIYTTDGSTPSLTHGTGYSGAITVNGSETIKAIAISSQSSSSVSPVSTAPYVIHLPSEHPLPTGEWAWEGPANPLSVSCGGPGTSGDLGVYGAMGVPAAGNNPGSRVHAMNWTDNNGNLWLFGGGGFGNGTACGVVLNDLWMYSVSGGEWTWMGGSSEPDQFSGPTGTGNAGVYGTQGQFAAGNMPGSREGGITWTDHGGNLWLFGGDGFDATGTMGVLNDVWEYKPSTHRWAWMAGSKLANGNAQFNSFGVFNSGNTPGARDEAVSWIDRGGNLWLFGGFGYDVANTEGELGDLWEFDPYTHLWAWMGGVQNANQPGTYGTIGVPSQGNHPGGRYSQMGWVDSDGNFWLFGGYGYAAWGGVVALNDMWEFNPRALRWTWISGYQGPGTYGHFTTGYQVFNIFGQSGVYGDLAVPEPGNIPGGRGSGSVWTDVDGNLWLFGGEGYDAVGNGGYLNDLWEFRPSTRLWAWMGGANAVNSAGSYGQLGAPAAANLPPARGGASSWTDKSGNFWLFGGGNFGGTFNDLWKYLAP